MGQAAIDQFELIFANSKLYGIFKLMDNSQRIIGISIDSTLDLMLSYSGYNNHYSVFGFHNYFYMAGING